MQELFKRDGTKISLLQDSDIESGSSFVKFPDGTLIVYGTKLLSSGWEQEVWIPVSFIKDPIVVIAPYSLETVIVTNRYTNRFYCYSSGQCYIDWVAIGRWK